MDASSLGKENQFQNEDEARLCRVSEIRNKSIDKFSRSVFINFVYRHVYYLLFISRYIFVD